LERFLPGKLRHGTDTTISPHHRRSTLPLQARSSSIDFMVRRSGLWPLLIVGGVVCQVENTLASLCIEL
jgi:hypothetical protein